MSAAPSALTQCWRSKTAKHDWSPEQRLALAVLDQAIDEAHGIVTLTSGYASTRRNEFLRVRAEAQRWLESPADDYTFAFVRVCASLGLDPGAVRAQAALTDRGGGPHK